MGMLSLVLRLSVLNVNISGPNIVHMFLSIIPTKFTQMGCSIETVLNLDNLSVEDLISWLKAAEEQDEPEARQAGKLFLSKEEWVARISYEMENRPAKPDTMAASHNADATRANWVSMATSRTVTNIAIVESPPIGRGTFARINERRLTLCMLEPITMSPG
jgi:predicted transcriptional regulator